MARHYPDWIEAAASQQDPRCIPPVFARWSAISAIAGAAGRKVYLNKGQYVVWPNMFIMLIGNAASGKSLSLDLPLSELLFKISKPFEEKDDISDWKNYTNWPIHMIEGKFIAEKLLQDMDRSSEHSIKLQSDIHSGWRSEVTIVTSEFGMQMNAQDSTLQTALTHLWDGKNNTAYRTKNRGVDNIKGGVVNWIACAVPSQFARHLPKDAYTQGLFSRMVIVFSAFKKEEADHYEEIDIDTKIKLAEDLGRIANVTGEITWSHEARVVWQEFLSAGLPPKPSDPIMESYCGRRTAQFEKLAMIYSLARRDTKIIELEDLQSAQEALLSVERNLMEIIYLFKRSEAGELIDELRQWIVDRFSSDEMPVEESRLNQEILMRCKSSAEVPQIVSAMKAADIISPVTQGGILIGYAPGKRSRDWFSYGKE